MPVEWLLHGDRAEPAGPAPEAPPAGPALDRLARELLAVLGSDLALDRVTHLPPRYREQYRDRIKELSGRVRRQLDEYRKVLEAEYRAERAKRGSASRVRPDHVV